MGGFEVLGEVNRHNTEAREEAAEIAMDEALEPHPEGLPMWLSRKLPRHAE